MHVRVIAKCGNERMKQKIVLRDFLMLIAWLFLLLLLPWIIRFLLVNKSSNCKRLCCRESRAAVSKSGVHNMPSFLTCFFLLSEMKYSHDIYFIRS